MDLFAEGIGKAELSTRFQRQLAENKTMELFKIKKWFEMNSTDVQKFVLQKIPDEIYCNVDLLGYFNRYFLKGR